MMRDWRVTRLLQDLQGTVPKAAAREQCPKTVFFGDVSFGHLLCVG